MPNQLIPEILKAQKESSILDADQAWEANEKKVVDYCRNHLKQLDTLPAYVTHDDPGSGVDKLHLSDSPKSMDDLMSLIDLHVTTPGLNPASGGHLGYIPGGGVPVAALGDYIAAVTNKYAGVFYGSPGAVRMENFLIRWMCDIVGYPSTAFGNLTSGGSIANLIAIICARDKHNMIGSRAEKGVIYLSSHAHHCVAKSLRMAGLSCCQIRLTPLDKDNKINTEALKSQINSDIEDGFIPFLAIGSAGTTDTGVIDPLADIGNICKAHNMWFHVDAAYGGFFILLDELKDKFDGIELSDSVVLDPHKGLFLPYGSGTVLVKDKNQLKSSYSYEANYMQDASIYDHHISPSEVSPELTKHYRGMRMWLPLQLHGLQAFKSCLQEKILLTRYFYDEIQKLGFEVGTYPELSVMTYRYVPKYGDANAFNKALVDMIREDGTVFVSSTNLEDKFVIRLAVLSFRTHLSTIDTLLDRFKTAIAELNKAEAFQSA